MYIITNRRIDTKKSGLKIFGDKPNTNGAQELTMVKVTKKAGSWAAKPVTDKPVICLKRPQHPVKVFCFLCTATTTM